MTTVYMEMECPKCDETITVEISLESETILKPNRLTRRDIEHIVEDFIKRVSR